MRKACIFLGLVAIITLTAVEYFSRPATHTEYFRIHIRANSNEESDQAVKYRVKDKIVELLTPKLALCDTKQKAIKVISDTLSEIEVTADGVLSAFGKEYRSSASVREEEFPTRKYESLTLKSGYYDALIVKLGDGAGDNWWCVIYPPLCFVGSGKYEYRSKIKEIIERFFNKEKNETEN